MEKDEDIERLDKALTALREHFDTVHIFATRETDDGEGHTWAFQKGSGNYYARYGQIKLWTNREQAADVNADDKIP